jgi:hypothetical protein
MQLDHPVWDTGIGWYRTPREGISVSPLWVTRSQKRGGSGWLGRRFSLRVGAYHYHVDWE